MFNLFKLFKKKPKKQYKLSDLSFRRVRNGRTQVYHTPTNEWLYWYLIVGDVTNEEGDKVVETDLHHALIDINKSETLSTSMSKEHENNATSDNDNHTASTFAATSSNDWSGSSSSGGSSSYSSSSSSSDSGSFD